MWTLIITILWYHAPAVASVPGFQTYEACAAAAKAEKDILAPYPDYGGSTQIRVTYVCAKL